jgi:predicted permease
VVSIVIAVGLNALGARRWIPDSLLATAQMLGACAFPLGIVLIGATIADSGAALRQRIDVRTILWSSLVRMGLMPLVILGAAWLLPVEPELQQVLVVQAAMPVAIFPIVLARLHGGDPLTAVRIVVGSSLLGLLTIPLWLKLGLRLVAH